MSAVTWNPTLASGDGEIDGQHQEMFRRLGELVDAIERGRRDEVPRMFEFLGEYVVAHFLAEERAMARCAFPGENVHRAAHARFLRDYAELRALYEATGPTLAIAVKTATWIRGWLEWHIQGADRVFARYLREAPHLG